MGKEKWVVYFFHERDTTGGIAAVYLFSGVFFLLLLGINRCVHGASACT